MIGARIDPAGGFTARLAERAQQLAEAFAQSRRLARQRDPARWRSAKLLWPIFPGEA